MDYASVLRSLTPIRRALQELIEQEKVFTSIMEHRAWVNLIDADALLDGAKYQIEIAEAAEDEK